MLRIAVPTNDGELVSDEIISSLLFLIYDTRRGKIISRTKRAQIQGIMATIEDCHVMISRNCPEPVRELLQVRGIQAFHEDRRNADRAVAGFLEKQNEENGRTAKKAMS